MIYATYIELVLRCDELIMEQCLRNGEICEMIPRGNTMNSSWCKSSCIKGNHGACESTCKCTNKGKFDEKYNVHPHVKIKLLNNENNANVINA